MKHRWVQSRRVPFAARAAGVFFLTLAVLFLLLLAAYALPGERVRQNVYRSARIISQEGLYPEYFGCKLFQMDNYTDTLMLFTAATADEQAPLSAMMTNTVYNIDNFETLADDLAVYCEGAASSAASAQEETALVPFSYARYWHGYLIWLRPLLLFTDLRGVRAVQYAALFALLAAALVLLRRRIGMRAAVWFAVSQVLVTVWWVPRQIQFFTCFAIAYAGCVWLLARERHGSDACLCLLALGAATSFCDLLVTPILTLGLPLTCFLLVPAQRRRTGRAAISFVFGAALCWGAGYALCWAFKWVLAGAVTGQNVIADALTQIGVRTAADTWHGMELTWGNILQFIYNTLSAHGLLIPLLLAAAVCIVLFVRCLHGRAALMQALPLALCAVMPLVWYAVLRTHSIQHGWFTWRALTVTVFAGGAFVYFACDARRLCRRKV